MEIETTPAVAAEAPTETVDSTEVADMTDVFKRELNIELDPKEEPGDKPNKALDEGLPKEPEKAPEAPAVETPAEKVVTPPDEDAPKADEAKPDDEPAKEEPAEDLSVLNEMLGIEADDAKSAEDWKSRNSETRKYADELSDKLRAQEEALALAGRQFVNTDDGLKLAPTEDAEDFKPESVDAILKSLTDEEKELFTDSPEEAAKLIAERTIKAVADKFTPIQANAQEKRLTTGQLNDVYGDFLGSKMSDGKTERFPNADDPEIVDLMQSAFESLNPAFKEAASKNEDVQRILLEHLFNKVGMARQAQMAFKAEQTKAQTDKIEAIKKEPSLSASGASELVKGQGEPSKLATQVNDVFAAEIAKMSA
jgi:hypothetical protein